MAEKPKRWGVGSSQYRKRPGVARPTSNQRTESAFPLPSSTTAPFDERSEATGITWDSSALDLSAFKEMSIEQALARFRSRLSDHVWDAAALEGNPFTLPEVQTLLEGVTVGGHRLADEQQIVALAESSKHVAHLVETERFALVKNVSDSIHELVARHEAIESGHFRGEGSARGGGLVRLGEWGEYQATETEEGGENLIDEYHSAVEYLTDNIDHPAEQAMGYFMVGAYRQFYSGGNKRTSRLNMNGHLLSNGFDAISIPAARRLEFNEYLRLLYVEKDGTALIAFISDCLPTE